MFPVCDITPRFLAFYMEICTMTGWEGVNFIFERAGGTNIFVRGRALRTTPPAPHRGDTPGPYPADRSARISTYKKIDPGPSLMPSSSPLPAFCFPAILITEKSPISLNTYLANIHFTLHRPFASASGCSATFFYPSLSSSRL